MKRLIAPIVPLLLLACAAPARGTEEPDRYVVVKYEASTEPGGLQMPVTYTLWIPGGTAKIRGIIVHQHGCGTGACRGGETAAYDLHWQALARKWHCALMGPSYGQGEKQNCRLWCDPRNGSDGTFLRALDDLAAKSGRPEIAAVPWCLWGHSGGGFWSSLMQTLHPDRILAIWLRSGTAFATWEKGDIPAPKLTDAIFRIPVMCNPGLKEKDHQRFKGAYAGTLAMVRAYRAKGAPIGFAPDPRTAHECGDSRYLAIPWLDACLAMRLGDNGLKPATAGVTRRGAEGVEIWLPDGKVAAAWEEYVKTGAVGDTTPPPAPRAVRAEKSTVTWTADADFESGIRQFIITRDGKEIGRVPAEPEGRFGRPLFQSMSYHDTPEAPLPKMTFTDPAGNGGRYGVVTVNGVGLESKR